MIRKPRTFNHLKTPSGVHNKPIYCANSCPRAYEASGFVADYVPENPRIAFLLEKPTKEDITKNKPLASGFNGFFWQNFGHIGFRKDDCIFAHMLRCYTWKYPTGATKNAAEKACRHWDSFVNIDGHPRQPEGITPLAAWSPNIFVVTFGLDKQIETPAFQPLAIASIKKAWKFAQDGYRPIVLLGSETLSFVAPWLKGGVKRWQGHWWEGEWNYGVARETEVVTYKEVGKRVRRPLVPTMKQEKLFT